MASFGLNEHHHSTIVNYMRFARYQRGQRLKAVDASFKEMKDSRLTEDTFTLDEVTEMLDSLHTIVRGDVEMELINTSHTNVLLLMQLFEQAEKWHLKLQADVSSLENRELLEQIKDFEEEQFSGRKGDSKSSGRLQPLNEGGGATLLNMEIERLNEENKKLQDRLKQVESVAVAAQKEKAAIKAELDHMDNELKRFRKSGMSDGEVADLRAQMENLKVNMDKNMSINRDEKLQLESDLSGMKHEVLRIREMLEMAEKELEKKVSNTAPYINLKQMMQKKNEQMKDLRKRLSKYEKVTDD